MIAYVDPHAVGFARVLDELSAATDVASVVLRYRPARAGVGGSGRVPLFGFGLDLALRSTEYKVIDDKLDSVRSDKVSAFNGTGYAVVVFESQKDMNDCCKRWDSGLVGVRRFACCLFFNFKVFHCSFCWFCFLIILAFLHFRRSPLRPALRSCPHWLPAASARNQ